MKKLINKIRTSKLSFNILFALSTAYLKITNISPDHKRLLKNNFKAVNKFSKLDSKGKHTYINGQGIGEVAKLPFGKKTISYCGCGAIATYNSLVTLKDATNLANITSFYELDGLILDGTFGIHPNSVKKYFTLLDYKVDVINDSSKFDEAFKDAETAILLSWNSTSLKLPNGKFAGMHYVSISKNDDRGINIYNSSNVANHSVQYTSIKKYIKNKEILPVVLFVIKK